MWSGFGAARQALLIAALVGSLAACAGPSARGRSADCGFHFTGGSGLLGLLGAMGAFDRPATVDCGSSRTVQTIDFDPVVPDPGTWAASGPAFTGAGTGGTWAASGPGFAGSGAGGAWSAAGPGFAGGGFSGPFP
jgi:hypothetical protein